MSGEIFRGPRARRQELGETWQHRRMLGEQREVNAAATDGLEQVERSREDRLRIRGVRCDTQKIRYQGIEALAREDRELQVASAFAHAAKRGEQIPGRRVAGSRQRCLLRVRANRIEPDRDQRVGIVRGAFAEYRVEMALDRGSMP